MIKRIFHQTSTYYYILFVLVLLYNIFLLNKGIGIDEGWYLSLIKDQPDSIGVTQFYKLINFFETNNIILNRFIFLIVDLLSVYVFSFGLRIFLLKKEIIDKAISLSLIFSICYLSGFLLTIPVSFTFYSVTMNKIILCISSGFLLTHLFSDENKNTSILLYFSGFFLGVQFFSMITTITIWLLFSVLIIFTSKKQKLDLLYFISGITSVIILYFLSIQPFDDFWQKEILATVSSVLKNKQDSHSTGYLIQWIVNSFIYIFFLIILPTILSIVLKRYDFLKQKRKMYLMKLFYFIFIIIYVYFDIFNSEKPFSSYYLFYIIFLSILLRNWSFNKNKIFFVVSFCLILLPFLLSFGSDIAIKVRGGYYVIFIIPLAILISKKIRFIQLSFLIILFSLFINNLRLFYKKNWEYFIYSEQTIPFRNILVNKDDAINLSNLKNNIKKNEYVIFNEYKFWKYIYLNNYRSFSHAYKPSYSLINLKTIDTLEKFYILENHYNSDKYNLKQLPDSINKKFTIEESVFFPIKLYEYTKIDN